MKIFCCQGGWSVFDFRVSCQILIFIQDILKMNDIFSLKSSTDGSSRIYFLSSSSSSSPSFSFYCSYSLSEHFSILKVCLADLFGFTHSLFIHSGFSSTESSASSLSVNVLLLARQNARPWPMSVISFVFFVFQSVISMSLMIFFFLCLFLLCVLE